MIDGQSRHGFSLFELAISLLLVGVLLAILVPTLAAARRTSYRDQCHERQRLLGQAWEGYLIDNDERFPYIPSGDVWEYGGVRFPVGNGAPFVDYSRPLNPYLPFEYGDQRRVTLFRCPADRGIRAGGGESTEGQSAYRAHGTSFRPNEMLLDAVAAGVSDTQRGLARGEITAPPARLLVLGDAAWRDYADQSEHADAWHGEHAMCNCLFLDGSVRFREILPRGRVGPVVFDPLLGSRFD